MTANAAVFMSIATLAVLLMIRVPVAFSLAFAGGVGLFLLEGWDFAFSFLGRDPFSAVARFSLVIIPLFILMGMFAKNAGLGEEIFWVLSRRTRRIPGGLAFATILACAGFAAVSGSSVAAVATLGPITITEMRRYGYPDRIASGVVAAGGTLGILIPPSLVLVLYGVVSGLSIERLLIAGIIPGVISAIVNAFVSLVVAKRSVRQFVEPSAQPVAAPARPVSEARLWAASETEEDTATLPAETDEEFSSETLLSETVPGKPRRAVFEVVLIFTVVVGGLYFGVFTATESAAMGAIVAFAILVLRRGRRSTPVISALARSFNETVSVTAVVFALLIGAKIFTTFLVVAGVPRQFGTLFLSTDVAGLVLVAVLLLLLIPLGMFLDGISILLIMVPLVHPLVTMDLGLDGLWFAILMVKVIEVGLITPPVGINAYVVAASVPNLKPEVVFRGVVPYYVADLLSIAVLFAIPGLVTWLPSIMVGS